MGDRTREPAPRVELREAAGAASIVGSNFSATYGEIQIVGR